MHIKIKIGTVTASKVKPEEILYADDQENNLTGAKELGIQTFVFENPQQFSQKPLEHGINLV